MFMTLVLIQLMGRVGPGIRCCPHWVTQRTTLQASFIPRTTLHGPKFHQELRSKEQYIVLKKPEWERRQWCAEPRKSPATMSSGVATWRPQWELLCPGSSLRCPSWWRRKDRWNLSPGFVQYWCWRKWLPCGLTQSGDHLPVQSSAHFSRLPTPHPWHIYNFFMVG